MESIPVAKKKNGRIVTSLVIALGCCMVAFVVGLVVWQYSIESKDEQRYQTAESVAKKFISARLKSPGSAEFSNMVVIEAPGMSDTFEAVGDVDSQNSFGALLRSHFFIKFGHNGQISENEKDWKIYGLRIDNVQYYSSGKEYNKPLVLDQENIEGYERIEDMIRDIAKARN